MKKIKVLLIDDSNIVHIILKKIIDENNDIELIGSAYDGIEGIELAKKLNPEVIITDIHMPKMNGLDVIKKLMEEVPRPIIVFSMASKDIIGLSFKAIELGAVDLIEKPFAEDFEEVKNIIKSKLLKSIRTFADFKVIKHIKKSSISKLKEKSIKLGEISNRLKNRENHTKQKKEHGSLKKSHLNKNFPIIGIAASTGGPQTLKKFLNNLNLEKINAGLVIVQHMASGFMEGFCDWLRQDLNMNIKIADKGDSIEPNTVYIAPEKYHLIFDKEGKFDYLDAPAIMGIKPSADIMLSYMSKFYKKRVIAVILTGMGSDGTKALEDVKNNGGIVIAQNEKSSLIFGMPKSAIESGYVDNIIDISELHNFLERQ